MTDSIIKDKMLTADSQEALKQTMWQSFVFEMNKQLGDPGLSIETYIPASGLSPANWELLNTTGSIQGIPGTIIVKNLESWCNSMPVWGSPYLPGPCLYDNYSSFIYSLILGQPGDPAQQQIATAWANKVKTLLDELNKSRIDSANAWSAFNNLQQGESTKISYADWYKSGSQGPNKPQGPSWQKTIADLETQKTAALVRYKKSLEAVGGKGFEGLNAAIESLRLSASAGNQLLDEAGVAYPKYTVSPGLNEWFLKALLSSEEKPEIDFHIDMSSVNINTSRTVDPLVGKKVSFAQSGSASDQKDISSLIQHMDMTYKAQSASLFEFTCGSWFDGNFMSNFKKNNADNIYVVSPNSALSGKDLFGPNGIINLRTKKGLVVFKPSITLKGSSTDISSLKEEIKKKGSVKLAGMTFDSSELSSHNTTDVTMQSNSNTPVVIGVVLQELDK